MLEEGDMKWLPKEYPLGKLEQNNVLALWNTTMFLLGNNRMAHGWIDKARNYPMKPNAKRYDRYEVDDGRIEHIPHHHSPPHGDDEEWKVPSSVWKPKATTMQQTFCVVFS